MIDGDTGTVVTSTEGTVTLDNGHIYCKTKIAVILLD